MTEPFRLEGVFSVLPTVFHHDGALDLAGTTAVATATIHAGVAGLTVLGVMGEAGELTEDERREVVRAVRDVAAPLPVVVGVSGDTIGLVEARARDAARQGVGAMMISPSRSVDLSAAVDAASAGGIPIVIQDYPSGSGVVLTVEQIEVAIHHPLVAGVKAEAPPTSDLIAALRRRHPGQGAMGGLGGLFLVDELRAGATGVMTGFALPERLVSIVATFPRDPAAAEREWLDLLPLMRLEAFPPLSLAARKEVWRLRGVIDSSHCRRAGARLDDLARDDVRRALEHVAG